MALASAWACTTGKISDLSNKGPGANGQNGQGGSANGAAGAAFADGGQPPQIPFEPQAPEAYVSRVKNLVNGGAITAAELAAVKGDPSQLGSLIDGWIETSGFQQKMMGFFKIALQQGDVNHETIADQNGEEFFANPVRLFANLSEMASRTAWDAVSKRRPFNEVVNTQSMMMTTAVASYLEYVDVDYGVIVGDQHTFYHAPPANLPAPPWSLDYSIQNKSWFTTEDFTIGPAGKSCPDPWPLSSFWLLNFLHGALHCNGYYHNVTPAFTDADFNDWHMVRMVPADGTTPKPRHYDIPMLRGITALPLAQPRFGFFTTPAFFANWPTNASNSSRVTANQALIVALGMSITPDAAVRMTGGVDSDHAAPGSPCFGCHQFLDPMRNYFRHDYSDSFRPQTDAPTKAAVAGLSVAGASLAGGSLGDFANTLANHSAFAPAWVQKLCYYANTVGCDPADPVFQSVVAAFVASHLDFKVLVRELYRSPLVTGAESTLTWQRNEFPISMMRRQHLCATLSTRLGVSNACDPMIVLNTYGSPTFGPATLAVTNVPDDAFGRGSVQPFLATVPDMFYRGNIEVLCSALADQLVDVDQSRYTSTQSGTGIADMVATVMGLPANDARAADMQAILTSHFSDAEAAGATPTEAMKSVFTLACTSPFSVSLGF